MSTEAGLEPAFLTHFFYSRQRVTAITPSPGATHHRKLSFCPYRGVIVFGVYNVLPTQPLSG